MKRNARKLCAVVLMVSMLFSLLPGAAFAAPANGNSGLKQYTSMEDLIQDAIDELQAQNAVVEQPQADAALVSAVESQSDRSFDEVKSAIAQGLFANYETGVIDTTSLNLRADELQQLMEVLLAERYMTNAVTYQFDTDGGVVSNINFTLSDGMRAGMAGLASMQQKVDDAALQQAASQVAAEAVATEAQPSARTFSLRAMSDEEGGEGEGQQMFTVPGCDENCITMQYGQSAVTTSTTVQFIWTDKPTEGDNTLKYDAENDAIGFAPAVTWDSQLTAVEYDCPYCGNHIVLSAETLGEDFAAQVLITDPSLDQAPANYDITLEDGSTMTYMTYRVGVLGLPVFEDGMENYGVQAKDENGDDVYKTDLKDISAMQALYAYAEMCELIEGKPECFGIPTAFWTSKETDADPFGAIKIALNQEYDATVPPTVYAQYIPDLTAGFSALVYHYEGALQDIAEDAQTMITAADEVLPAAHKDAYKMLLLHDWLSNVATFDMATLLAMRDPDSSGEAGIESLLGMTPFTMLSKAIGYDGGVCLGYTASYAYIVQNAFAENYYVDGDRMKDPLPLEDQDPLVDFAQIRFNCDPADVSVAGDGSGFEGRFREPHFFNANKVGDQWYYVDVCYDDVNPEVISQQRVETDGNISHMYFLAAPSTLEDQFEGKCDYIDSLYDGRTYFRPGSEGSEWESEEAYTEAVESGEEDAGWEYTTAENETRYEDTTYEDAWFNNAQSQIILHDGYWYYVEGLNAYNSMRDMDMDFGESGSGQISGSEMMDMMAQQQDDPSACHELKRRSIDDNGSLPGTSVSISQSGSQGGSYERQEDEHAYGLFHYGYGYVNYGKGAVDESSSYEAVFTDEVAEDMEYRNMYPELSHGVGLYDGKLYFNVANKILCYDLSNRTVSQIKEYNDVSYTKDEEKVYEGMAYTIDKNGTDSFRYHPIAGLSIHGKVVAADDGNDPYTGGPTSKSAEMVPTMSVAIATNLSESYKDADGNKYKVEAVNYNPSYQRYLDTDKDPELNSNVEFMWCANLTEEMDMETLVSELASGDVAKVSVDAFCHKNAFTEERTTNYGLSDGSTKTEEENTALNHKYKYSNSNDEEIYVCSRCNHCPDKAPEYELGDVNCDGYVDVNDLTALARYLGGYTDDDFNLKYANLDGNSNSEGKDIVDTEDLAALARILGGYES